MQRSYNEIITKIQPNFNMNLEERQKLRLQLKKHYGSMTEIATRSGVSHQFVYMVLTSERNSSKVLLEAAKYLAEKEEIEAKRRTDYEKAMIAATKFASV